MVGGVTDVITCAKFQIQIFMGYDFTGGRIFDFCIDFSMGLTTVQRYCAACDQSTEFYRNRCTSCGNKMSYPFLKMAAATAKYYFRFRIC